MSSGEAAHKCLNGRREMRPGPSLLTGADHWTFPRHAVKVYRLGPHIAEDLANLGSGTATVTPRADSRRETVQCREQPRALMSLSLDPPTIVWVDDRPGGARCG
jgi:hypothetical protein